MKKVFLTFEDVKKKSRMVEKLQLLEKIRDCDEFKFIVDIVYNKSINTYVSYDILMKRYSCGKTQEATWEDFVELVSDLVHRRIVGSEKDDALASFFKRCDEFHCKWFKLILSKDLRIGVGRTLIKQLLGLSEKDFGIKFSPMLAFDITSLGEKADSILRSNDWFYETKIDGLRVLTIFTDGRFECLSRNSKRLVNVEKFLLHGLDESMINLLQGWVLDGEFYAKNWSKSMTSVFSKNKEVSYSPSMKYYVFDIIKLDEFSRTGVYSAPYEKRKEALKRIMGALKLPFTFVEHTKVEKATLSNVIRIAEKYVKQGWEGIILKAKHSPYVSKRSKYWLKVKLFKSIDVLCTGIIPSTKNPGEIAAITFRYKGKECKCGSGFTQEQRKLFFTQPDLIVDKVVEIRYQEESVDGCLRFPVFVRVRYDKTLPDV